MENIAIFENKIKVNIYGPNLEIENADCSFTTMFTEEKEPNTCTLKIYNLTDEKMNSIVNNTKYVEIKTNQYNIKDSDGNVLWQRAFEGLPREIIKKPKISYTKKGKIRKSSNKVKILAPSITVGTDEADDYIELDLQEGMGAEIGTFVSKSYKNGFNVKKILTDLAEMANLEIVFDKNIKFWNVTYPIILHGNVRDSLIQVASYIGCTCIIAQNRALISGQNKEGVILYYQFDEENTQRPNYLQDKKIEFYAPYMPFLLPGQFVKLINKKQQIDGVFQIAKIESSFSNYSEECESKITVRYD